LIGWFFTEEVCLKTQSIKVDCYAAGKLLFYFKILITFVYKLVGKFIELIEKQQE
jgi:hypothetical protein